MKKTLAIMLSGAMLLAASCSQLDDMSSRLDALESTVQQLSGDLVSLQSAVDNSVSVVKVETIEDGYVIYFSDNTKATIKNGEKGDKGDTGAQGEKGDKGDTGAQGEKGDAFFQSVTVDGNTLVIVLVDGSTYVLPIYTVNISSVTFVPDYADGAFHADYVADTDTVSANFLVYPLAAANELAEGVKNGTYSVSFVFNSVTKALTGESAAAAVSVSDNLLAASLPVSALSANSAALLIENSVSGQQILSSFFNIESQKVTFQLGGESYKVVKMKDGSFWTAENLRYLPEDVEVSATDFSTNTGVWYPVVTKADKDVVASTDAEVIKAQGYFYSVYVALANNDLTFALNQDVADNQGICPNGWHIPTSSEVISLVGKCNDGTLTNVNAPYYNAEKKVCYLSDVNADGFNYLPYSYVNAGKSYGNRVMNTAGAADYIGMNSMDYIITSTGRSATQIYAMMLSNVAASTTLGDGFMNLTMGAHVRCIRNK